jgi:hypothetical protein
MALRNLIDLTGQRFGKWRVVERYANTQRGDERLLCVCDCGTVRPVSVYSLRAGLSKSCGCHKKVVSGMKFGRLTVVDTSSGQKVLCECECGKRTTVNKINLLRGSTLSCGCFASDVLRARNKTHGDSKTRLYRIYNNMKARCTYPTSLSAKNYIGRGISICDDWLKSYENFRDWALSNGYGDNLSLDRIDNNGNYDPSNCRWATRSQQNRNTRRNIIVKYQGEILCLKDAAKRAGINYATALARVRTLGWSVDDALSVPVGLAKDRSLHE